MERLFTEKLEKWGEKCSKPLMVIGLRQIGKTYVINKFCEKNFENYLYFNFEEESWLVDLFDSTIKTSEILEYLGVKKGVKINLSNTVLFFDEVQISERFITSLKYFCEYEENVKIICAGSLLGVKINRFTSSFPIGKVTMEYMYPMNFQEFLMALGKDLYIKKIKEHYKKNEKLEEFIHKDLIELLKKYLLIGGMPESIKNYVEVNQDILLYNQDIISTIKEMYIHDMVKYVFNKSEGVNIEKVFRNIPLQLSQENKKFKYSKIEESARKRNFESSIDWLISCGLVLKSNNIKVPAIPLNAYVDQNSFKLFLSDVGILGNMAGIRYSDILLNENFMYKGAIIENYIATEFNSSKVPLRYWTSESRAKIDFIIHSDDGIIPIEVKSSINTKSKSLNVYKEKYKPNYSIRLSNKNFGFENNIKSVPLYATFCIAEEINIQKIT